MVWWAELSERKKWAVPFLSSSLLNSIRPSSCSNYPKNICNCEGGYTENNIVIRAVKGGI